MAQFVIRVDGDRGELFVDGERAELFGALVGVDVRRDVPHGLDLRTSALPPLPVVEVTLRLPLRSSDTLTVLRDMSIEDLRGPTDDGEGGAPSDFTTVVPGNFWADLEAPEEPNERVRKAALKLPEVVRREEA